MLINRKPLQSDDTIPLTRTVGKRAAVTAKIISIVGAGGSFICYDAYLDDESGRRTRGILKEFYPAEFNNEHISMQRLANNQLVAVGKNIDEFCLRRDEIIRSHMKIDKQVSTDAYRSAINSFLLGDFLFPDITDASNDKEYSCSETVYTWSKDFYGIVFSDIIHKMHAAPEENQDEKLFRIIKIILSLAYATKSIHQAGLLHLDITPSNFLVEYQSNDELSVDTCGVRFFDVDTVRSITEQYKPILGISKGFCAPEVKENNRPDNRSDIYSIGAVLFSAIIAISPSSLVYEASEYNDLKRGIYNQYYYKKLKELLVASRLIFGSNCCIDSEIMNLLLSVLNKCLHEIPDYRYDSCSQLIQDLEKILERIHQYTECKDPEKTLRLIDINHFNEIVSGLSGKTIREEEINSLFKAVLAPSDVLGEKNRTAPAKQPLLYEYNGRVEEGDIVIALRFKKSGNIYYVVKRPKILLDGNIELLILQVNPNNSGRLIITASHKNKKEYELAIEIVKLLTSCNKRAVKHMFEKTEVCSISPYSLNGLKDNQIQMAMKMIEKKYSGKSNKTGLKQFITNHEKTKELQQLWQNLYQRWPKNLEDDDDWNRIEDVLQGPAKADIDNTISEVLPKNDIQKPKTMTIVSNDGSTTEVELIFAFEFKDNKKEYVIYTKNEYDDDGNVIVYVSNIDRSTGEPILKGVTDKKEWDRVREVLKDISGNEDSDPIFDSDGVEII